MLKEFKLYFYRHNPFLVLSLLIIIGCLLQYMIFSGNKIDSVKDALNIKSDVLIFQNFSIDTISLMLIIYFIYCCSSSIINDKKNGVWIYSLVKNKSNFYLVYKKIFSSYLFLIFGNLFTILIVTIISIIIYGGNIDLLVNAFILLLTKTYTAIFYATLAIFFALLVNNYVFVLSILFLIEISKLGFHSLMNEFSIFKFFIFNNIDISSYFTLPSNGIGHGYSFTFTIVIYLIYILLIQLLTVWIFKNKRGKLI